MEKKIKQHLQSELQRANQNAAANADLSDIVSSLSGTYVMLSALTHKTPLLLLVIRNIKSRVEYYLYGNLIIHSLAGKCYHYLKEHMENKL